MNFKSETVSVKNAVFKGDYQALGINIEASSMVSGKSAKRNERVSRRCKHVNGLISFNICDIYYVVNKLCAGNSDGSGSCERKKRRKNGIELTSPKVK